MLPYMALTTDLYHSRCSFFRFEDMGPSACTYLLLPSQLAAAPFGAYTACFQLWPLLCSLQGCKLQPPGEDHFSHPYLATFNALVQSSGKLPLTNAYTNGGGTALPQRATCADFRYFGYTLNDRKRFIRTWPMNGWICIRKTLSKTPPLDNMEVIVRLQILPHG